MDLGDYSASNAQPTKKIIPTDDALLELAAEKATYSTEKPQVSVQKQRMVNSTPHPDAQKSNAKAESNFINISGRRIAFVTKKVDPADTMVWEGNPRNFEPHDIDTSDLWPLINASRGNTMPVYGRYVMQDGELKLQILAGSRRRACCLKGNYQLLVHIIECNDAEAAVLSEQENKGRKNTSFIADCRMYLAQYTALKEKATEANAKYTQQSYASLKGVSLTTMQDYLAFAKFPDWLILAVRKPETWSYRSCNQIRKGLNVNRAKVENLCSENKYTDVQALIRAIEYVPRETKLKDESIVRNFNVCGIKNAIVFNKSNNGTVITVSPVISNKLFDKIADVIEDFAD